VLAGPAQPFASVPAVYCSLLDSPLFFGPSWLCRGGVTSSGNCPSPCCCPRRNGVGAPSLMLLLWCLCACGPLSRLPSSYFNLPLRRLEAPWGEGLCLLFLFSESPYVAQSDIEVGIILPQPPDAGITGMCHHAQLLLICTFL
jgi:hypothetical protein